MAENILRTRVQLKYDTLANWSEKNPTLLAGELAIVSLGNSHTTTTPDNGTHPILFKVGPGAFNSLPFASALAADVYGWAKLTEAEFVDSFLSLKATDGSTLSSKLDGVFATDEQLTNAIAEVRQEITNLSVAALEARVKTIEDNYETKANVKKVADDLAAYEESNDAALAGVKATAEAAVTDAKLTTALEPYAKTADVVTNDEFTAFETTNTQAIADAKSGAEATAAADATQKANAAQQAAEGKVTELAEGAVATNTQGISDINTTLSGYGDIVTHDAAEFATAAQGALADTAVQPAAIANMATTDNVATAKQEAIDAAADAAALIYKTEDQIKTIAADEIGRLIDASGDAETLKSIGDLVDYAEKNAGDIAQLVTDVNTANTNASNAVNTANTAASDAATAKSDAATALSTANEAKETATAAKEASEAATEAVNGLHEIATSGSLYDAENVGTAKNSEGSDVPCLIFYCGTASDLV